MASLSVNIYWSKITTNRIQVENIGMVEKKNSISLDELCGRYLTFRDLIECGQTQTQLELVNTPQMPETYSALRLLAREVLDPVIDHFGHIRLSFGFCSKELANRIPGGTAPRVDQHAGHELNTRSEPICRRLGAAADFSVSNESMITVAAWIAVNTRFDRMYIYGDDRPLHVSVGPDNKRQVVDIHTLNDGRRIPRNVNRWQDFFGDGLISRVTRC